MYESLFNFFYQKIPLLVTVMKKKQDSIVCREWLTYLNNKNIAREVPIFVKTNKCNIHENKFGETCKYYNLNNPFTVDGYDNTNKTIYQFQGCYWHGCRKCNPEEVVRYDKTMEQNNLFRSNGYTCC